MAIGDSREEEQLFKDQRSANTEFRNATKVLGEASKKFGENSLRQELGLTKAGIRASLEDKLLGTGMKRTIYNFLIDKKRASALRKEAMGKDPVSKARFKALAKQEKQRKKDIAVANAQIAKRKARDDAIKATLGEEAAAVRIKALNENENADLIKAQRVLFERDMENAFREKEEEDKAAALRFDPRRAPTVRTTVLCVRDGTTRFPAWSNPNSKRQLIVTP